MIQIDTTNRIILDGQQTGLALVQRAAGTVIYTPESKISGTEYQEHKMPESRYSTVHDAPASGVAGCDTLEMHIRTILRTIQGKTS